jgi:hypothetical protein
MKNHDAHAYVQAKGATFHRNKGHSSADNAQMTGAGAHVDHVIHQLHHIRHTIPTPVIHHRHHHLQRKQQSQCQKQHHCRWTTEAANNEHKSPKVLGDFDKCTDWK